jgi:hypothetical protein
MPIKNNPVNGIVQEPTFPKLSNQNINITTPENKTYTSPMEGYYPAKYGFEDESIGTTSTSIDFVDTWSWLPSYVSIESEIGGHTNVLREEFSVAGHGDLFHYFDTNHSSGIFEFWFRTTNPTAISQFLFMEGGTPGPHPQIVGGYFNYYDGSQHALVPCNPNQWYHLKFEWFANNTFDWYVNSTKILDGGSNLNTMTDGPDRIRLTAYGVNTQYFDAFGNSWDTTYNIGDNLKEGLLLSFDNHTILDWIGYSLDGQSNKTILGNTTIIMPNDGSHTIQVFGNDSLGTIYSSDIRYFSVDILSPIITIISPKQNEYFGSTTPAFDLTIIEPTLNVTWYTLDNGLTNITFTGLTGTIDQTEWDKKGTEPVTIMFYANNTGGFLGHADVVVNKELDAPTSLISFTPHSGTNTVIGSTLFTITANDGTGSGVSIIRYSINNSGWMDYSIPFSLSGRSAGDYLISYQAIDAVNNVETINSIVVELIEITSGPPEIPGYNIVILFGIICVISVTLLKKRYNNIK